MAFRTSVLLLAFSFVCSVIPTACGSDGGGSAPEDVDGGEQDGGSTPDGGGFPPAEPSDPCLTAGYYFDGDSDCDVVRCPELQCECEVPTTGSSFAEQNPVYEMVTLHACVQGLGCLDLADCTRVCDSARGLTRSACEARIESAGAVACTTDDDCVTGRCREESIGSVCVDVLPCAEDGHCGEGSLCRFDPSSLDDETGLPISLGACSDGGADSVCYENDDCQYRKCSGNRCAGGREGDECQLNDHCASGLCRNYNPTDSTGSCVSGVAGSSCTDDGDCQAELHCSGGICFTSAVGQNCDEDTDCASGVCVSSRCRGGEPGSYCQVDEDCDEGVCAAYLCASGGLLSPCYEPTDCQPGLRCARQVCTDGSAGSPCSIDADCAVRACVRGACSVGENGDVCDAPDDCASNRCADPAGVEPGECTSGAQGSRCVYGQNCVSGNCSAQGTCN